MTKLVVWLAKNLAQVSAMVKIYSYKQVWIIEFSENDRRLYFTLIKQSIDIFWRCLITQEIWGLSTMVSCNNFYSVMASNSNIVQVILCCSSSGMSRNLQEGGGGGGKNIRPPKFNKTMPTTNVIFFSVKIFFDL